MSMTSFILNDAPYGSERTYNGLRLGARWRRRPNSRCACF